MKGTFLFISLILNKSFKPFKEGIEYSLRITSIFSEVSFNWVNLSNASNPSEQRKTLLNNLFKVSEKLSFIFSSF